MLASALWCRFPCLGVGDLRYLSTSNACQCAVAEITVLRCRESEVPKHGNGAFVLPDEVFRALGYEKFAYRHRRRP